ncbi:MAG: hypothetical protein ACRD3D_02140 [Terriglobia bacterium]
MFSPSIRWMLAIFVLAASLTCLIPTDVFSCCDLPDQELQAQSGSVSNSNSVGGLFVQTISYTADPNEGYDGDTVEEANGQQGNNGCYFPGSDLGEHPGIMGLGGTSWRVGSAKQWGPDEIGLLTIDAQQIYQEEQAGAITMTGSPAGCDTVTYQAMSIDCGEGFEQYEESVEQDRFVYPTESMKACRNSPLVPANCSGSIIIPPV